MDCDMGLDDAIAMLLALAHPEAFDILGVTTVVGNGPIQQTQENARRICELAGQPDVKVFQGCARPFFPRSGIWESDYTSADVHGETGLGGCKLPSPSIPLQPLHAVDFVIKTVMECPDNVTIHASGPLTNIACALIMEPNIKNKIEKIVIMGGVIGTGNITPAAEFNFYSDPHAAAVVFTSGIPLVMLGLDITRQIQTSETWIQGIETMGTPVSQAVVDMLSYYHRSDAILEPGVEGGVLHDPNIIAYLLKPELYKGRHVYVEIDTSSTVTSGRSTVDWFGKLYANKPNAYVINEVNVAGFFDLLTEAIRCYNPAQQNIHKSSHC